MTVHERADGLRPERSLVAVADVDAFTGDPYCPCCRGPLSEVATPTLDADHFEEYSIDLPVFGWRCRCRRVDIAIVAPIEAAPAAYEPVTATIDEETVDVGVPAPALEGVPADV